MRREGAEKKVKAASPFKSTPKMHMSLWILLLLSILYLAQGSELPADLFAASYRNWSYFSNWIIPPSCVDSATCPTYGKNNTLFSDIFQVWSVSDPYGSNPPSPLYQAAYTFYDGVGYQTARATSNDLVHFTQPLAPEGILYSPRTSWVSQPGQFDYGGAAFVGPLLQDLEVSKPRVLARGAGGLFWYSYFAQDRRGSLEPAPGATGLASSEDGLLWKRAAPRAILDTNTSAGARGWESTQVYAPFLVPLPGGGLADYYNAKGGHEQSGRAVLAGGAAALPGFAADGTSQWVREAQNPILTNGPDFDADMASDPKVFFDKSLGATGAYVMLYFGLGGKASYDRGAAICIAFSLDGLAWTKASTPLYLPGGHPGGLDKCHAHKAWLTADDTGRKYLYYTGDNCKGRGILLLTSTPLG